ncbi:MAG: OmpA family protein [Cyclobacteriaceae bacterium]|nr:OmpA family protein [Cyclobacteriaceae bacterium]
MNIIKSVSLITLVVFYSAAEAQTLSTKNKKAIDLYIQADNYRVRGQYDQAISMLQEAIDKDKKFEEAYNRLAIVYRSMDKLPLATENFEQGLQLADGVKRNSYLYELADIYLRQGDYVKSDNYSKLFLEKEKMDKPKIDKVKLWSSQANYAITNANVFSDFVIEPLPDVVNKYQRQYFPVVTGDDAQLIFTARFGTARNDNEDIVISTKRSDGTWGEPISISNNINTIQREGACTISADGRHLIFTVCGAMGCDLYESRRTGKDWSVPKNLGAAINSPDWDSQPTLSADGRELYFVSDRKGGVGGYDLWYSNLEESGWTKAKNLGKTINTPFDEISPYIHVNNQDLYMVSNGYPGFGGYDIYRSQRTKEGWGTPTNLGKPLNDHLDQYSFIVSGDGAIGYYSRAENKSTSRLFKITLPENLVTRAKGNVVKGIVRNAKTNFPMGAWVELFDLKEKKMISKIRADSMDGDYLMILPGGSEYALYVRKPGFLFQSLHFNYEESSNIKPVVKNINLIPIQKDASVVLNNLFFDVNKYELKPQSITELEEVVIFLNQNKTLKVEIGGHTDNSGTEPYNQQLSERRAHSVAAYLTDHQIEKQRILVKGYGSQKPIAPNDTEENKQLNRRIEFKIISN